MNFISLRASSLLALSLVLVSELGKLGRNVRKERSTIYQIYADTLKLQDELMTDQR